MVQHADPDQSPVQEDRPENNAQSSTQNPVHLLVLVHGFIGHYTQMNYLEKRINQIYKDEILVLKAQCNSSSFFSTNDGVDAGGTRLTQEIKDIVNKYPTLKDFSILGNSLGGLYARYTIGHLFSGPEAIYLKPKLFVTTVCPHLGVRATLYPKMNLGSILQIYKSLHRTGLHLMLADGSHSQKPLLFEMTEHDSIYIKALEQFEERIIIANYLHDSIVPYCTAAIVPYLPTLEAASEKKPLSDSHPHIVGLHEDAAGLTAEDLTEGNPLFLSPGSIEIAMLNNLRRLSWKRVDVLFEGPMGDPHDSLILANGRLDARDVIDFMISRFFPSTREDFLRVLAQEVEDYIHHDAKPTPVKIAKSVIDHVANWFR